MRAPTFIFDSVVVNEEDSEKGMMIKLPKATGEKRRPAGPTIFQKVEIPGSPTEETLGAIDFGTPPETSDEEDSRREIGDFTSPTLPEAPGLALAAPPNREAINNNNNNINNNNNKLFPSIALDDVENGGPFYTLSVTKDRVTFFMPDNHELIVRTREQLRQPKGRILDLQPGRIYRMSAFLPKFIGLITTPTALALKKYTQRGAFACPGSLVYRTMILQPLLLGCRVRDYEQRCATVEVAHAGMVQLKVRMHVAHNDQYRFKTACGEHFDGKVLRIDEECDDDKSCLVTFEIADIPRSLREGCLLELFTCDDNGRYRLPEPAAVTAALFKMDEDKGDDVVGDWKRSLLNCIYGPPKQLVHPAVSDSRCFAQIKLRNGACIHLNQ